MQTESAVSRVKELISRKNADVIGIRLGVKTRGCNGLSYTMNYVEEAPKGDDVVPVDGASLRSYQLPATTGAHKPLRVADKHKLFIDPKAIMFVVGSEMDFVENELTSEFVFNNPNAKGECGCGESFKSATHEPRFVRMRRLRRASVQHRSCGSAAYALHACR